MEQLEASILGTVFRNKENGYSVLSVNVGSNQFTVVGSLPELAPGETVLFSGDWVEHKSYGRQFRCVTCEVQNPSTRLGMERYLASGLIRGIGPSTARQILSRFGDKTLEILAQHPERLTEIPGIGKKRVLMISQSFQEQQGTRRAMVFLQSYGISPALSIKIAQHYGDSTPDLLRENPYRLCDEIEGVGFLTADRVGMSLGIPPDSESRIRSAIIYTLNEAAWSSGHVFLPEDELLSASAEYLNLSPEICARSLKVLLLKKKLVAEAQDDGSRSIYLPFFYDAEIEVARRIKELMAAIRPGRFRGARKAVSKFEKTHRISFSPRQRETIIQALETGVFVITGGPGTGKTTIIECILDLLSSEHNEVLLCAPTGRAAKRMTEATGTESRTIHRLLEYSGEEENFSRNRENPLEADCVIADEASMIDLPLMQALLRAIEPGTRLILVGDADQLPSVGPGNVLRDILSSGAVPSSRLTDIFRQSESSRIALNAHRINNGEMPLLNGAGSDFFFERKAWHRDAASAIVALASERLPLYLKYASREELSDPERRRFALARATRMIQVLAPAKKGECGVNSLNIALQAVLNPPSAGLPELSWGDCIFRAGDKVIQTRNNYEVIWQRQTRESMEEGKGVFNGDIGFIRSVNLQDHSLTVVFDDDKIVDYGSAELEDLSLAYCLSVHKSQGSEFPVVILPVVSGPPMLLTRNLLYTALTRAKSLVVLVGTEDIIHTMVVNDHVARRYTDLSRRLSPPLRF